MCGIAGLVTKNGAPPDEGVIRRMAAVIAHRGPDGEGVWTSGGVGLAHRRLAIIDLSEAADQPMHDVSGRYSIVFNGEIYNYRELRDELVGLGATFRSQSDTEVILEAFKKWNVECAKKFRGMFAFAVWDSEERRLFLSRDRIGKKPLFYAITSAGDLAFASELKALAPVVPLKPDWNAVRLFLGLQYVPSPLTGFENVKQLLPGEHGLFDEKGWRTEKYHSVNEKMSSPYEGGTEGMDQTIRQLLSDAVRIRQLASDVPVGAFLSGGIDSAAVVAFASAHVDRLQTFTMGFPSVRMDERTDARSISAHFGTDHHEYEAKPQDLLLLIDELIGHYDAPYADSSALPLWLLARETSKHIKVVLTGDGGDELFGGYRRYAYFQQARWMAKVPGLPAILYGMSERADDPRLTRMAETVAAFAMDPSRAYGELFCGSYFSSAGLRAVFTNEFLSRTQSSDAVSFVASQMEDASLDAAMRFDLTSYLPDDLNVKMDRATMRFGLEARSPFLDQELVAFTQGLPLKEKVHHGKTKIALRRALRGIVPDEVLQRKKKGFQVPLDDWFRGPLVSVLRERLLDPSGPLAQIAQPNAIERLVAENERGMDHGNRLWMLLSLATWLQTYGT